MRGYLIKVSEPVAASSGRVSIGSLWIYEVLTSSLLVLCTSMGPGSEERLL